MVVRVLPEFKQGGNGSRQCTSAQSPKALILPPPERPRHEGRSPRAIGGVFPEKTAFELMLRRGRLSAVSIVTRTGDNGTTALMYSRRVPKHHVRVEAYGAVDELNASLGLARAFAKEDFLREVLLTVQQDLVAIMGELATALEDQERYSREGYPRLEPSMIQRLEARVAEIEAQKISFKGWATPGATPNSAALDVARTVCRRAERRISEMLEAGELPNVAVLTYFNRLADLLWLLARWVETREGVAAPRTTS